MFDFWKKGPCIEEPPTLIMDESVIEANALDYEDHFIYELRDRIANRAFGYEDLPTKVSKDNMVRKVVKKEHVLRAFIEYAQEMIEELKQHETR